jgi:FAD dependent oxidoreductase
VRVAVVGAGVYGATIAVELARAGHRIDLYERHRDLLHGATRAQQARLHLGYHYPRSLATALACKQDAARFQARFPLAVNRRNGHYYAIADRGSLTSPDAYLAFCEELDAGAKVVAAPSWLDGVSACVRVPEALVNVVALREQLRGELRHAGVGWHRDADTDPDRLGHDLVVMATYGRGWPGPLQWEVCEVARLRGTWPYAFRSVVILDGPFCSLDPLPGRPGHLLYHVDESVHAAQVGDAPKIPGRLAHLLDAGVVHTNQSRWREMAATARRFFPRLGGEVAYDGSLFTVRAVLPSSDATDTRPTVIRRDGRLLWVLAGKIDGAPAAAERVAVAAADPVAV